MSGTPHDVFSFLYFMVVLILVTSTSVCTGMASVSRRILWRIVSCLPPLRRFEEDLWLCFPGACRALRQLHGLAGFALLSAVCFPWLAALSSTTPVAGTRLDLLVAMHITSCPCSRFPLFLAVTCSLLVCLRSSGPRTDRSVSVCSMLGATADACSSQSTEAFCCDGISTAPRIWQPLVRCLAGVYVCGFSYSAVFGSTVDTGLCQSTKVSLVTVSASQQRQLGTGQSVQLPAWIRMLTYPLLCSTDARYRRAENCGAPQLPCVDQVEASLFGNRDRYAQCNCAVVSYHGWCLLVSWRVVFGALHTGAGPGRVMSTGTWLP